MRASLLVILAILAGAVVISYVTMRPRSPKPKPKPDEERFLEAQFISIGAGINTEALAVVLGEACEEQRAGRAVRVLSRRGAGFEGERDLCIEYATADALKQSLASIRSRLPREPGSRPLPRFSTRRECSMASADRPYAEIDACKEK